jgi:hypothetical protein
MNPHNRGLGFPLNPLPILKKQLRKRQATQSMPIRKMMGCDTETIKGKVWLFSTEKGVWEIEDFSSFMDIIYSRPHLSKWKKSAKSGKGKKLRGFSPMEFFLWNLKFDAQAIFHLLDDEVILSLMNSKEQGREGELGNNKIIINADTGGFEPEVKGRMVQLDYLEGKSLMIKPLNWYYKTEYGTKYHLGTCYWWDISQFYGKMRLNDASKIYLGDTKIETLFDGEILDASRFDEKAYRQKYIEDIKKYAIKDAVLTGELARRMRNDYVKTGIRFIRPYSLANVAQRNLLDMCNIPTINCYSQNPQLNDLLLKANSAFLGGRFETSGCGYLPDVQSIDLSSAYPYWMYWLPNTSIGKWYRRHGKSSLMNWMEKREPHNMGFVEASFLFDSDSEWNPLCVKKPSGTLVSPRLARGWFTANEVQEALKWPLKSFRVGEWFYHKDDAKQYPFRKFVHHYYNMKSQAKDESVERWASKTQLNSIFGKTRQAVDNKAGKLWNSFYAATITGNCRAQLAEIVRLNDYSAVQLATDGVFFETDNLVDVPNRPLPATGNLGQWELENQGEFLCLGSGIYSMRDDNYTKTRFRGTASYFLRDNDLFTFCKENEDYFKISRTVRKPFSAKEARARGDMSKMNVFRNVKISMSVQGDSEKRVWENRPQTFKDIQSTWWPSRSYLKVQ